MPNRVKAHPAQGHIMRRIHGAITNTNDGHYRIERKDGVDGQWVSAAESEFVEIKR